MPGERRFGDMSIDDMDGSQRALNDWLLEYLRPGRPADNATVGGPMAALLHSPKLARAVGQMVTVMFDDLSVPRTITELAILVTAKHWNCEYEQHIHQRLAVKFGLDSAVVAEIESGTRPPLSADLNEVYDFTVSLLRDGDVSDEAFERVAGRWGLQGAVELITTVGFYTMLALILNVDRLHA